MLPNALQRRATNANDYSDVPRGRANRNQRWPIPISPKQNYNTSGLDAPPSMLSFILIAVVACALSIDAQIQTSTANGQTQFGPNAAAGLAVTNFRRSGGIAQLVNVSLNTPNVHYMVCRCVCDSVCVISDHSVGNSSLYSDLLLHFTS